MKIQIDNEVRVANQDEIKIYERISANLSEEAAQREQALETRKTILRKLGLSDQDIFSLFGF